MSKMFLGTAFLLALTTTYATSAESLSSGLKPGDPIGAFTVTKAAGAEDDGVEVGESLCYRCRYGSRPMVMIFARTTNDRVATLVKEIDATVAANPESQLKGLVTLLGENRDALQQEATKIVDASGAKHVPVTIAEDTQHGPANYNLDANAEVTVVVANDSQVVASHTFNAAQVDVTRVISNVKQILH